MTSHESGSCRRFYVPAAVAACVAGALCMPWQASVGSYGQLIPVPEREAIIRAAEGASLLSLDVQAGQDLTQGAVIGRMGNLDLEEQIAQARTELARADEEAHRTGGELRVQQQAVAAAQWQLAQHRTELNDLETEERQILTRLEAPPRTGFVMAMNTTAMAPGLPPALAALEAEELRIQAELTEADQRLSRERILAAKGISPRSQLEAAEARKSALDFDLSGARERLNAALTDHRRRHVSAQNGVNAVASSLSAEQAHVSGLASQLESAGRLHATLAQRLALLERKSAHFALYAPVAGTVFGQELPKLVGQYFPKGAEICRVADTGELLVRIQVTEQALADVALGQPVRIKTRAFPDRVFHGTVSRIGSESQLDASGQPYFRVELILQNPDGLLRPGMTAFARVGFGRHAIAWLAAHKLRQALRPELWML